MLGWSNFRDRNKSVYIVGLEQKKHEMSHEAIILLGYQAILIVGKVPRLHNECDLLSFKYLFIDGIYLRRWRQLKMKIYSPAVIPHSG